MCVKVAGIEWAGMRWGGLEGHSFLSPIWGWWKKTSGESWGL